MKNERFTVIAGMICLFALILAVIVVTICYMSDEPTWNRAPDVTVDAQNRPPGDGVTLEQDEHAERSNL